MRILLYTANGYGHQLAPVLRSGGHDVALAVAEEPSLLVSAPAEGDLASWGRVQGYEIYLTQPERGKAITARRDFKPDLTIAAGYMGSLLPADVSSASKGGFTLHPSLLPKFKGDSALSWVLIEGESKTGVSVVLPGRRTVFGDLVEQTEIEVRPDHDDLSLRAAVAERMAEVVPSLVARAEAGELTGQPFPGSEATHLPALQARDGIIAFNEPTAQVRNRIRGTLGYPRAYALLGEARLQIRGVAETADAGGDLIAAGLVLGEDGELVKVKTADGAIGLQFDAADLAKLRATEGPQFGNSGYEVSVRISTPTDHEAEQFGIPQGAEDFPQMVVLAVAYPCNALCPHCPYTPGNSHIREWYNDAPFISEELFKKIADECGQYGSFLRITGGGEPFMHPNGLTELVEYAKSVGSKVWINTNGSLTHPERSDRLIAAGVDMMEFSVDAADEETYNVVRAGLDWKTLVKNVKHLVKARNEARGSTRIVVSVVNQDVPGVQGRMDEIANFWSEEVGVDEVIRRKFLTWGSNTSLDALHSGDDMGYLDKTAGVPCPFPFHRINVDSRGKIEVCGYDISGRTNFGSVATQSISEIWKGPEFTWWRRMHLERRGHEIPMCRECPDWRYRSWKHNWQKVLRKAEVKRLKVIDGLDAARAVEDYTEQDETITEVTSG